MNESCWSFFSVHVALRPTQNTIARRNRPPGLTGVRTVIAVALPSTFATGRPYRSARDASRSARRCRVIDHIPIRPDSLMSGPVGPWPQK